MSGETPAKKHVRLGKYDLSIGCHHCGKKMVHKPGMNMNMWKEMIRQFRIRHKACQPMEPSNG